MPLVLLRTLREQRKGAACRLQGHANLCGSGLRGAATVLHALLPAVQAQGQARLVASRVARPLSALPLADLVCVHALLPLVRPSGAARRFVHAGSLRSTTRPAQRFPDGAEARNARSYRDVVPGSGRLRSDPAPQPDETEQVSSPQANPQDSPANRRAVTACWESTNSPSKPAPESSPSEKIAFGIRLRTAGRVRSRGTRCGRGRRRPRARWSSHLRSLHRAGRPRSRSDHGSPIQLRSRRCRGAPRAQPSARRPRLRRLWILWRLCVAAHRLCGPTRSEAKDRVRGIAANRWPRATG